MKGVFTFFLLLSLAPPMAESHEVRPAYLGLRELEGDEFEVVWKVPARGGEPIAGEEPQVEPAPEAVPPPVALPKTMPCGCPVPTLSRLMRGALPIHPSLPEGTVAVSQAEISTPAGAEIRRWKVRLPTGGLEGGEIKVHGLETTMVDVLVRVESADGRVLTRLLRPEAPSFAFRADEAGPPPAAYFGIGVKQFLSGPEHLMFVLCLLMLARGRGAVAKTVSALILAQSAGLVLATVGWVDLPEAPLTAVIALGIVCLAVELAKRREDSTGFTERRTWLVATILGLLHGFDLAASLGRAGLPEKAVPQALLLFGLGMVLGLLAFVAASWLVSRLSKRFHLSFPASLRPLPVYGIGALASFWFLAGIASCW